MISTIVLAFAASALASNATGPWALHITGKTDSSIDGYGGPCHAGAAIEGICYGVPAAPVNISAYEEFYFNYTGYNSETGEVSAQGWVEYELPFSGSDGVEYAPSGLHFGTNLASNVITGLFFPGTNDVTYFSKHDNGSLYVSGYYDDTHNNETRPNSSPTFSNLSNFHLCYQWTGGYYYRSIAWVAGVAPPQNPSCLPVELSLVQA